MYDMHDMHNVSVCCAFFNVHFLIHLGGTAYYMREQTRELEDKPLAICKRRVEIYFFYFITLTYWFSLYVYSPYFSPYVESLGASHSLTGLILGSYGLTAVFFRLPFGIISDRLQKRKIFVALGMISSGISCLGFWLTNTPVAALVFRAVAGISASSWVVFAVQFAGYFERDKTAGAMSTLNAFCSLGQMTATFSGGLIAQALGWRQPFIFGASIAALGLLATFAVKDNIKPSSNRIKMVELVKVAKNHEFIKICLLAILAQMVTFATINGFIPSYAKNLGADNFELGLLTIIAGVPTIIASAINGSVFIPKFGERKILLFGFITSALFSFVIPFIHSMPYLYITQAFAGFSRGLTFPVLMGLSIKDANPDKRAAAMGAFQALYALGVFGGPFFAGFFNEVWGLSGGFVFAGFIALAGYALSYYWIRGESL
jgi:MFS family permease